MKKLLLLVTSLLLATSLVACSNGSGDVTPTDKPTSTPSVDVKSFTGDFVKEGESMGVSFVDTYSFVGETTDGIITSLTFDIVRNKGKENELSKKDIMGYSMNISEAKVSLGEAESLSLDKLVANGYDEDIKDGQFMVTGSIKELTHNTTLADLTFTMNYARAATIDEVLVAFSNVASENGIDNLSASTKVVELLPIYGIEVSDKAIGVGEGRVSFDGPMGGRSFGEQVDSLVAYILANKMTLEDVAKLLEEENTGPIMERDTIAGCTIAFTPEFKGVVANAMGIESVKEGVLDVVAGEDGTSIAKVSVNGYGGEILLDITLKEGEITNIVVTSDSETDGIGKVLTAKDSEFIKTLIAKQSSLDSVDVVADSTVTSKALIKAVESAINITESK